MMRSSFYLVLFHVHLLTVQQHVKSAEVISNHDLRVKEMLEDGDFTVYCKDLIKEKILSKSSREWCTLFDLSKDLIVGTNYCDRTVYEGLTLAACAKEGSVVMTTQTTVAATQPSSTPTTATTKMAQFGSTLTTATAKKTQPSYTAALSNHDLHVKELLENGLFTDDCKDVIMANILYKAPQEWCNSFDVYKDFIVDTNDCDRTGYENLTRAACTKEAPVVMTRHATMATTTTPTSHTSTPGSILKVTMEKSPEVQAISTEKLLLWEQTETPNHALTTAYHTQQTNGDLVSSSDTGSTTASDLFGTTEVDRTLENSLEDLLQQVLENMNKTEHVEECKSAALTKLTRGNDVTRVCATIKQLKEILDDKLRQDRLRPSRCGDTAAVQLFGVCWLAF
ncbi:unnamed protein product [Lymnaea stagnalis]|uniref:Uncharacterized protein n=1 Tax=Lymnaea stagnalis TaxID=6523 RepID=A0AAV2IJJ6_LYMST